MDVEFGKSAVNRARANSDFAVQFGSYQFKLNVVLTITLSGPSSVSDASRTALIARSGVVQLTLYLSVACAAIANAKLFHTHTLQHAVGCSMPHLEVHAVQQSVHKAYSLTPRSMRLHAVRMFLTIPRCNTVKVRG